jgi:hypothetical protein
MGMFDCCEKVMKAKKRSLLDIDWNEQRTATIGEGIMGMFDCCEEIMKAKKRSFFGQTSVSDFLKSSSGTHVSPLVPFYTGNDPGDAPTVQEKVPSP